MNTCIIIVPLKSVDTGTQKGLIGGKCVVFIPWIFIGQKSCFQNVIRYHYTKRIAGYDDSFEDLNQHKSYSFESNITIPKEYCEATSGSSLSFASSKLNLDRSKHVQWRHFQKQHRSPFGQCHLRKIYCWLLFTLFQSFLEDKSYSFESNIRISRENCEAKLLLCFMRKIENIKTK